jgi:hypothetical protein
MNGGVFCRTKILHLYIAPGHNYFGQHGRPPDRHPAIEVRRIGWMDEAFGPGAEQFLQGRGGLRAQILTDGELCVEP